MTNDVRLRWVVFLAAPIAFGVWSLLLGQDVNWDLRNYHWYNPYALLTGRAAMDGAPAGLQTWFAPYIEVGWFSLAQILPAPIVGIIIGAVHSANFVLLFLLGTMLLPIESALGRGMMALLVAVTGVCGAGVVTEFGTTTNDDTVSIGVLGSLCLVAHRWRFLLEGPRSKALAQAAVAGLPIGLAVAGKLTMVPFAIGLVAAFLVAPCRRARQASLVGGFAAGIAVPTVLLLVPWLAYVWHWTGNPIFPYLNGIFHSPLVDPRSWWQYQHQPASLTDALLFPLHFVGVGRGLMELSFRDWRILTAYVLVPTLLILAACLRQKGSGREPTADRYLFAAMVVAYALWVILFQHYRFILPLEMLSPLMIAMAIGRLPLLRWAMHVSTVLIMILLLGTSQAADYGHVPWRSRFVDVAVPALAQPAASLVLLLSHPTAYVIPSFPPSVRFLQLMPNFADSGDAASPWHRLMQGRIDAHRGDLFAIKEQGFSLESSRARLASYGLALVEASCRPMPTNLAKWPGEVLVFCPVIRAAGAGAVTPP
jgi:hypothetical protein